MHRPPSRVLPPRPSFPRQRPLGLGFFFVPDNGRHCPVPAVLPHGARGAFLGFPAERRWAQDGGESSDTALWGSMRSPPISAAAGPHPFIQDPLGQVVWKSDIWEPLSGSRPGCGGVTARQTCSRHGDARPAFPAGRCGFAGAQGRQLRFYKQPGKTLYLWSFCIPEPWPSGSCKDAAES